MNHKNISAILVLALAVWLIAGLSMWPVIILYWMVLTLKNVVDYLGR